MYFSVIVHSNGNSYNTTVDNFMDCGFVAAYYKIHILPQNKCRWPLCKSANVGIAAGNTAERYLQDGPIWLPMWQ
jgi:hypothetical protein